MEFLSIDSRLFGRSRQLTPAAGLKWIARSERTNTVVEITVISRWQIQLSHTNKDGSGIIETTVTLTRENCALGRDRTLFCCPKCQKVTALLYLQNDKFKCWQCHGMKRGSFPRRSRKVASLSLG